MIYKIAYFLRVIDGDNQLNVIDLAFMALMVKIIMAPAIDWPAVCSLVPVVLSRVHKTHLKLTQNRRL